MGRIGPIGLMGLMGTLLACAPQSLRGEVPFPNALEKASVTLSSLDDGQSESLIVGNVVLIRGPGAAVLESISASTLPSARTGETDGVAWLHMEMPGDIAKARLSMPEGVTDAKKWFVTRELPNGLFVWQGHAHGTFMGEMIGIVGLINEFLLQSVENKIRVFPCWVKAE
ncbi:MAG: hypothetical protein KAI66_27970 [Lentisphaeria bacterium]|nr:hypothetical protein [Lentisphaeria bacterium]